MDKKYLCLDTETTIKAKGNPFTDGNKLCYTGYKYAGADTTEIVQHLRDGDCLNQLQSVVDTANYLVAFNAKFDCHWLERIGTCLSNIRIWDCQYAEFLFSNQQNKYPSLDQAAEKYSLETKLDIIKTEFWDRRCSCHVSVVQRILLSILKVFVPNATTENMKELIEKNVIKENTLGDWQIQKLTELLLSEELRNFVLILKQRLENIEQDLRESTNYPTQSMIELWLSHNVKFVDLLKNYVLTTITLPDKLGEDCVEHVMLLWDMLRKINGWNKHSSICCGNPVDTIDIPPEIMVQYLCRDVELTEQVFLRQQELFNTTEKGKWRLFQLHMEDQVALREMERNGILYDKESSLKAATNAEEQIADIESKLCKGYEGLPINWDSVDHMSAYLYGGSIAVDTRIPVGVYKTGAKIGQTRFKIVTHEYKLPRLVTPLAKSELKKEGLFSTDDKTLRQLRGTKEAKARIGLLIERAKLEKLRGTYFTGFPKKIDEMAWSNNYIHSSLNQCVAVTGRLSSTNPNQQNIPPEVKQYCVSRYSNC